ncbi:MAG: hypothetical protein ACO1NM_11410 [Sphingobium phenoxybenzoativorans]|uniref:Uncharacterized protein n=1 Tax=Sphingobium phenoxybenzoativorans TaxID=1592790 RepID=A0A975K7B6_9SPHN|nr:hypothetical protein [Sphingobium phenoxybenzoativorans]QUT04792.1 hypothetical protein KFK14_17395 [Sphingobium phenoxybenzoativorans]
MELSAILSLALAPLLLSLAPIAAMKDMFAWDCGKHRHVHKAAVKDKNARPDCWKSRYILM